ncbi:MAG: ATP-binding protein [Gammaproteobacteria bacterium]|jgi:hypothetical protein
MDIDLADVTIHIDETLGEEGKIKLEESLRNRNGVVAVRINPDRPHLVIVEYNPKMVHSHDLVDIPRFQGLHAELVGL